MEPETKAKTLGIDYGEKRIGTALSDDLFITAQPYETVTYSSPAAAINRIKEIVENKKVMRVVVGIPLTLRGEEGHKAEEVAEFISRLQAALAGIEIKTWDERLTTSQAEKIMIEGGASRARRKSKIDTLAAAIMLQSYIDYVNLRQSAKHEIKR
jgi:putative Holliday junction resolvase